VDLAMVFIAIALINATAARSATVCAVAAGLAIQNHLQDGMPLNNLAKRSK